MSHEIPPQHNDPHLDPADIYNRGIALGDAQGAVGPVPGEGFAADNEFLAAGPAVGVPAHENDTPGPAAADPAEKSGLWSRVGGALERIKEDPAVRRVGRAALVGAGVELGVIRETSEGGVRLSKTGIAKTAAKLVLTRGVAIAPLAKQAALGARERAFGQFKQEVRAEMRPAA